MTRRFVTRLGLAVSVAAIVLSLSASAVLAGEITGNGKSLKVDGGGKWGTGLHARSLCAYSGHNDDPEEEFPFGGQAQSYGYTAVRNGFKAFAPSPGVACNPNGGFEE